MRHPLQPFAPAAFGDGDEPRRFSYRDEWHPAADLRGGVRQRAAALARRRRSTQPVKPPKCWRSIALRRFLCDPAGQFLRERMGLRLPDEVERADDTEPLLLPGGGWERTLLQRAVFDALVSEQADGLYERLLARALLPSGPLGRREFDELLGQARPFVREFVQWRSGQSPQALVVEVEIDGTLLRGRIENVYAHGIARVRIGEPDRAVDDSRTAWTGCCCARQGRARSLVQVHDDGDGASADERPALAADAARGALRQLLQLREHGMREALAFAPYSGWELYRALRDGQPRRRRPGRRRANAGRATAGRVGRRRQRCRATDPARPRPVRRAGIARRLRTRSPGWSSTPSPPTTAPVAQEPGA